MDAAMDNIEIAVKEIKRTEDYKSPGRLKAEEKAEKIRSTEEYKRKLEAENSVLPPKKTKAAEQKEQEKTELAQRELAEKKAQLHEKTSTASQHVADAIEKIEALKEKIERTEAEMAEAKKEAESMIADAMSSGTMQPQPIEVKNVTIKLPVASFTAPYAVKCKKTQRIEAVAPNLQQQPQQVQPMYCAPAVTPYLIMTPPPPSMMPSMSRPPRFNFVTPPTPSKPSSSNKTKPNVMPIDITGRFGKGDINKPAIAYGSSLSGAEFDDALSVDTMVFEPIDADDFDSDFDNTRAVESTVSELQQTVGDLDTVNDEKF